jgi:hypothetical protein
MSTIDVLEQLAADAPTPEFNRDMEPMLLSCLFDLPHFVPVQYLRPEFFETGPARVLVAAVLNYHEANGTVPTRLAIRSALSEQLWPGDAVVMDTLACHKRAAVRGSGSGCGRQSRRPGVSCGCSRRTART